MTQRRPQRSQMREVPEPEEWDFWRDWMNHSQRGPAWRQVGNWAFDAIEARVDEGWLGRTIEKYSRAGEEYILPSIIVLAPAHTIAFAELLELALRLSQLNDQPGMQKARTILNADPMPHQLLHLRVQLEVGALAQRHTKEVAFERPSSGGGAADVVIGRKPSEIIVETKAVLLDDRTRAHYRATDHLFAYLHDLELRYRVQCSGRFGRRLEGQDLDSFLIATEICARTARDEGERQVLEAWGCRVTFSPEGLELGTGLHGPVHETLAWRRTERILRKKSQQARHQSGVWLRVDALDGLWQSTPWASMELEGKLQTLVGPIQHALESDHHVDGIVITSGAARAQGTFVDESVTIENCFAFRRVLEPMRVRETMIVPLRPAGSRAAEMWQTLYDDEASWLDWALQTRNLPSAEEIFGPNEPS